MKTLKILRIKIGIKSLVSMKQKNNDIPSIIRNDERYIKDPIAIANTFNNFFTSIAKTVQKSSFQTNHLEVFYQHKTMTLS